MTVPETQTKSSPSRQRRRPRCTLCTKEIEGPPVLRVFDGERKAFCSEGCADVYTRAYESGMADEVTAPDGSLRLSLPDTLTGKHEAVHFSVEGMYCAGCAQAAERVLSKQPGVRSASVNFASEQGRIDFDPDQADLAAAFGKLSALGYRARVLTDRQEQDEEKLQEAMLLQLIGAFAFGMQVMLLYLTQLYHFYAAGNFSGVEVRRLQYVAWALATPALFYGGYSILRGAWRTLRARTAGMDTLVALGTLSAYSYSIYVTLTGDGEAYFDSVVMITMFIMVGRYLEKVGGIQARKDVRRLLQLQPKSAWKWTQGDWGEVEATSLVVGDMILIKPGERVPADAEIVRGDAAVDESLLTGESMPAAREPGDPVYAGCVVTDGALVCRVTHTVDDTRLAQIGEIVTETLNTKPPIQRLADRASGYFTYGILSAAALTFLGWWLLGGTPPVRALLTAVAVLVVACPCALGLATPLALAVALGRTAGQGILVRKPAALEVAAGVTRGVFDKTGTLTQGRLSVVDTQVSPEVPIKAQALVCLAAAVEQFSEHPVARAVVKACQGERPNATDFDAVRGQGVSAQVEGKPERVRVGSAQYLGIDEGHPLMDAARAHASRGETIIWVGWSDVVAGFVTLQDQASGTALPALRKLDEEHITTVMLSGDMSHTVAAIAEELQLTDFAGGLSPIDKAERIKQWQADGAKVAMVGDGVNDAPALAQADLSITVASGTDVAGSTSDVILTRDDLTLVPWLIRYARRSHRIIRENLGWAFAYNMVAVPLAALGIISPVIAAGTMATSSLLVVGNSLRLRR